MKFEETQRFQQLWIWIPTAVGGLVPAVLFGAGIYTQLILHHPFGNHPMSDTGLVIAFSFTLLLFLLLMLLLGSLRLKTVIDETGIRFRFLPFQLKYHSIRWEEVEKFDVIKYNPVRDYGGWGIRFGKKGRAYNVSGDIGLEVRLKTGRTILIGTQKEKEMRAILNGIR